MSSRDIHTGPRSYFMSAEIIGGKEISSALRNMPYDPELTKALRDAHKESAEIIAEETRKLVPVGTVKKRGKRLSETVKALASRTGARVKVGTKKVYYAAIRHQGTMYFKGVPYLRMAVSNKYSEFWEAHEKALNEVVDQFNDKYGVNPREVNEIARKAKAEIARQARDELYALFDKGRRL